tara:strand:+ start:1132 stop:1335 length:204 start_codon:yes stop_codon:yes gene_type:complete
MTMSFTGLTPIQFNALQVAVDHLEEHLTDVASGIPDYSVDDLQWKVQTLQKLIATKQIKLALREDES